MSVNSEVWTGGGLLWLSRHVEKYAVLLRSSLFKNETECSTKIISPERTLLCIPCKRQCNWTKKICWGAPWRASVRKCLWIPRSCLTSAHCSWNATCWTIFCPFTNPDRQTLINPKRTCFQKLKGDLCSAFLYRVCNTNYKGGPKCKNSMVISKAFMYIIVFFLNCAQVPWSNRRLWYNNILARDRFDIDDLPRVDSLNYRLKSQLMSAHLRFVCLEEPYFNPAFHICQHIIILAMSQWLSKNVLISAKGAPQSQECAIWMCMKK